MKYTNKILISACLLGQNVKYNGGNNSILDNSIIKTLLKNNQLIPVCPEVDGGLPTPRVPVELQNSKAINKNGEDKTKEFTLGANIAVEVAKKHNIKIAILKAKSPSCGISKIYDGSFSKTLVSADGIACSALRKIGIKIFNENNLEHLPFVYK